VFRFWNHSAALQSPRFNSGSSIPDDLVDGTRCQPKDLAKTPAEDESSRLLHVLHHVCLRGIQACGDDQECDDPRVSQNQYFPEKLAGV
jgi:hypothetical protein